MHSLLAPAFSALAIAAFWPQTAAAVAFQVGHRPEIGAVEAPKAAKAGQPIPIKVIGKKDGSSACGLVVSFGDGSERQFKINSDHGKLPVTTDHTYQKDGRYTIEARGRIITTNKECKGSAKTVIQIGEAKPAAKPAAKK